MKPSQPSTVSMSASIEGCGQAASASRSTSQSEDLRAAAREAVRQGPADAAGPGGDRHPQPVQPHRQRRRIALHAHLPRFGAILGGAGPVQAGHARRCRCRPARRVLAVAATTASETWMTGIEIVLLALLLLAIVTASRGVRTVPQGQVWTVERFGAFTRLLQPGLNLMIPFIDQVGRKLNVQEVVLDIPEQSVITRDNATVAGRRHRLLPRHGPGQGGLSGAGPGAGADRAGDDQYPRRHRRDGSRPDAVQRASASTPPCW